MGGAEGSGGGVALPSCVDACWHGIMYNITRTCTHTHTHTLTIPNEVLLPVIMQWERPQPAMHVPYLDPHIATSSFPVHVSYTNGVYMWRVGVGGWGLGEHQTCICRLPV